MIRGLKEAGDPAHVWTAERHTRPHPISGRPEPSGWGRVPAFGLGPSLVLGALGSARNHAIGSAESPGSPRTPWTCPVPAVE